MQYTVGYTLCRTGTLFCIVSYSLAPPEFSSQNLSREKRFCLVSLLLFLSDGIRIHFNGSKSIQFHSR